MKTRESKLKYGGWMTRSVLECGDSSPLLPTVELLGQRKRRSSGAVQTLTRRFALLGFCFLFSALCFPASGQFAVNWSTIDGGGGTSTGGVYSVSGTIGQPDAGPAMSGGQYAVTGGFWALYAIQTPGAPLLTIVPAEVGQATISWEPDSPGWVLQETLSLSPANWVNSPSGSTNPIVVPAALPTKFYRLNKP